MVISVRDFDRCCRCCLATGDAMKPLFGACLNIMLIKLMNLQVTPMDRYPQQMCSRCILKLSSAYTFYVTVLKNQKTLEEILKAAVGNGESPALVTTLNENKELSVSEDEKKLEQGITGHEAACMQPFNSPKETVIPHKSASNIDILEKVDNGRKSESEYEDSADNEESYQCSQCKYSSKDENDLKIHLQTHLGARSVRFNETDVYTQLCNICGARFRWRTSLHKHARRHRGGLRCGCGKTFAEASTLKVHQVSHSLDRKPYRCGTCPRSFTQQSSRNRHARQHETRPQIQCDECDKSFLHKFSLQRHCESAHSLHECTECKKPFNGKKQLVKHMKIHRKEELGGSNTEMTSDHITTETLNIQTVTVEFLCLLCTTKFQTRESLEVHVCTKEKFT